MKFFRHPIALPALVLLAVATNSVAQPPEKEPEKDRWYNVELIIFSRPSASAATAEAWESLPELKYPLKYRFLQYPGQQETIEDSLTASEQIATTVEEIEPSTDQALDPNQFSLVQPELLPTPFVRLPGDKWEFAQRARRMQQSGRYEILFHESWNQPVVSDERTLPIILDQSGYLEEWPKLQGSITLYLARYLHLETNFWVNTTGSYIPGDWQMPPAPLGPAPATDAESDEASDDEPPIESGVESIESVAVVKSEQPFSFEPQAPLEMGPTYPWRHAVLLQQKRKMRSKEVHYIDHPMMGVIVLITPITQEQLEAMAIEEFGLDPNQPL